MFRLTLLSFTVICLTSMSQIGGQEIPPPVDTPNIDAVTPGNDDVPLAATSEPDLNRFQGKWMCVAGTKNGDADFSYVGVRAIFTENNFTWEFPKDDGTFKTLASQFRLNSKLSPKQFDWWRTSKPDVVSLRLYEFVDNDTMRWATNMSSKSRPTSFDDAIFVFTCKRLKISKTPNPKVASSFFGELIDPDKACTIDEREKKLTIGLPPGQFDLQYSNKDPAKRFNAPRVLQKISGDFTAQVKVTGNWYLGEPSENHANYSGAGLFIWQSENQYLRHERSKYFSRKSATFNSYISPLYDSNRKRFGWKAAPPDFFKGDSTWLRMERAGKTVTTYISHDGKTWLPNGRLKTEFPHNVLVGVHAVNGSARAFEATFEEFSIRHETPKISLAVSPPITVAGWGEIHDPVGNCEFWVRPKFIGLTIPPGTTDYWYGREDESHRFNAPLVLQTVEGDFTARVKVTCKLQGKPLDSGSLALSAGLIVLTGEDQYFRYERNRFESSRNPGIALSWTPPIYDVNKQRKSKWKSGRDEIFKGKSTWLWIARRGQELHTAYSHDGKDWTKPDVQATSFPKKVKVGLIAHSSSQDRFNVNFADYSIKQD